MNDYEGVYTPEEVELNKKLLEECVKEKINLNVIEELLKKGADPLGATDVSGWDVMEHVYGEILYMHWKCFLTADFQQKMPVRCGDTQCLI